LNLLPEPRSMSTLHGVCLLGTDGILSIPPLPATPDGRVLLIASRLRAAFSRRGCALQLAAGRAPKGGQIVVELSLQPQQIRQPEGYRLEIMPQRIDLRAHDEAGLFYGTCTLAQMLEQVEGRELPCMLMEDWPDYPVRGVMLDISRDKVPTLETVMDLVERLAGWKINQFQLYTEHTFAYCGHRDVWAQASPFTAEEILILDSFCRERFVELVPNQNSFGHMARWLKHARYSPLAETMDEFEVPWGREPGPFSLAPLHPGSLELLRDLYDELLPNFSSRQFNVGLDETFDLGQGQSRSAVEEHGLGRVYLEFLQKVYAEVSRRGRTMQFWGDIITQQPQFVPELPRDAIALLWGYEDVHPFERECPLFREAGLNFYVCPGTSSWNSLGGRTRNALGNLINAAENGLKHGAIGYLNTDWGDFGHWQPLPVSYLGFMLGAAAGWNVAAAKRTATDPQTVKAMLSRFAFDDPGGAAGELAYEIGSIYEIPGIFIPNSSVLFWVLRWPVAQLREYPQKLIAIAAAQTQGQASPLIRLADDGDWSAADLARRFDRTTAAIDNLLQRVGADGMTRVDGALIRDEFSLVLRLMRHACDRARYAFDLPGVNVSGLAADVEQLRVDFNDVWLARNRPGGLADSAVRFDEMLAEYRQG